MKKHFLIRRSSVIFLVSTISKDLSSIEMASSQGETIFTPAMVLQLYFNITKVFEIYS